MLKGIGIAEVFVHHSFASSARKFSTEGSAEWWSLMLANRILHFAIPTFLLVSAILLARSLSRGSKMPLGRYAERRLLRTVWPYLIWSAIYLLFRAFVVRSGTDADPYQASLPGFYIVGPKVLLDGSSVAHDLIWGKSYFHLYFLSVLVQLSVLVPVLVWVLRRRKLAFAGIVAISGASQLAFLILQRSWFRLESPASLALSYCPAILIGVWLGLHWGRWPDVWARNGRTILAAAACSLPLYLLMSSLALRGQPVASAALNAVFSLYATSVALGLLGLATHVRARGPAIQALVSLGGLSLPLFVIHPIAMYFLGGPRITSLLDAVPGSPVWALALVLAATLAITKLIVASRLDPWLFARRFAVETVVLKPAALGEAQQPHPTSHPGPPAPVPGIIIDASAREDAALPSEQVPAEALR